MSSAKPTFLIIGAARSGTTTLYHHLQQHPDIFLPADKRPEPHFFLKTKEYAKGIDYYCDRYFSDVGTAKAIGEASTSYLFQPYVPARIREHLPDVRLVAILRDPISRAFSNYRRTVSSGLDKLSFDDAVRTEGDRQLELRSRGDDDLAEIAPFAYLGRSRYFEQLARYLEMFDPAQLLVLFTEDLEADPVSLVQRVYGFVGVDRAVTPKPLDRMLNSEGAAGASPLPATRQYLCAQLADDVAKLEALTGRDLSAWLNRPARGE